MGAPTWPPTPPRSGRPGLAVAPLDDLSLGAPTWPPTPPRSGRPGLAVAPLDALSLGAPTWPPTPPRSGRPGLAVAPLDDSRYAFGAPSADASRARRRACAALSRAIGIMNGEQDTYVMPTL